MITGQHRTCSRIRMNCKELLSLLLIFSMVFAPAGTALTADAKPEAGVSRGTGKKIGKSAQADTLWSVQAGSFHSQENAIAFARSLRSKGVAQAAIVRLYGSGDRLWHVVEAGVFTSRIAAEAEARSLRERLSLATVVKSISAALHAQRTVSPDMALSSPPPALPQQEGDRPSSNAVGSDGGAVANNLSAVSAADSREQDNDNTDMGGARAVKVDKPEATQGSSGSADSDASVSNNATELTETPEVSEASEASVATDAKITDERAEATGAGNALVKPQRMEAASASQPSTLVAAAPENVDYTPFAADAKQTQLIVARTMFRQGEYDDALKMYDALMIQYSDDPVVWEHYTDTLIEARSWARADTMLSRWREAMPHNRQAVAQTARFYVALAAETGEYHLSYPWFEELLRDNPEDTGAMTDYAFARQAAGDWATALALFAQVSEKDIENDDTRRAMQTILRDRVPRLEMNFRSEVRTGDTSINTWNTILSAQASPRLRLETIYDYTRVDRRSNAQDGTPSVAREAHHRRVRGTYQLDEDWALVAGVGQYAGTAEGVSVEGGADWQIHQPGVVRLRFATGMPWIDTVDATDREGTQDSVQLEYDGFFDDRWGLRFLAGLGRYNLGSRDAYALQEREEAGLFYRLTAVPDWSVGYSFTRTRIYYRDSEPPARPVDLVEKEDIHGLRTDILQWYNDYIALRAFGSGSVDAFRNSPLWSAGGGVRVRTGERLEFDLGVEYNSDSGQVGGGESKALTGSVLFRF